MAWIEGGGDNLCVAYRGSAETQPSVAATVVGADGDGSPVIRYRSAPVPSMLPAVPATVHQQC